MSSDIQQHEKSIQPEQPQQQQQLEGYTFIKTLGKGNFGKVKLGLHVLTGEYVAIKILQKDLIFQKADIQRISREIKIMKLIRHPNIIQLYEIIEMPKRLYLIMEYAEGGDLFDLIVKSQRLNQKTTAQYFSQIILGLEYLHSKGVAHRDMKPQNILIEKGKIKIADFGLGNFFNQGQMLKTACGSPCYASPQMLQRVPYNPQKIDIWSSGIILYAMVCGYLPFEDEVTTRLYQKIKNNQPRYPKCCSEGLKSLLKKILDKNPQTRYNVLQIKQDPWIKKQYEGSIVEQFQVDMQKMNKICQIYGISQQEKLVNYLKKNKHNNLTTIYYLACRSKLDQLPSSQKIQQQKTKQIMQQIPNQKHEQVKITQYKQIEKEVSKQQKQKSVQKQTEVKNQKQQSNRKATRQESNKQLLQKNQPEPKDIEFYNTNIEKEQQKLKQRAKEIEKEKQIEIEDTNILQDQVIFKPTQSQIQVPTHTNLIDNKNEENIEDYEDQLEEDQESIIEEQYLEEIPKQKQKQSQQSLKQAQKKEQKKKQKQLLKQQQQKSQNKEQQQSINILESIQKSKEKQNQISTNTLQPVQTNGQQLRIPDNTNNNQQIQQHSQYQPQLTEQEQQNQQVHRQVSVSEYSGVRQNIHGIMQFITNDHHQDHTQQVSIHSNQQNNTQKNNQENIQPAPTPEKQKKIQKLRNSSQKNKVIEVRKIKQSQKLEKQSTKSKDNQIQKKKQQNLKKSDKQLGKRISTQPNTKLLKRKSLAIQTDKQDLSKSLKTNKPKQKTNMTEPNGQKQTLSIRKQNSKKIIQRKYSHKQSLTTVLNFTKKNQNNGKKLQGFRSIKQMSSPTNVSHNDKIVQKNNEKYNSNTSRGTIKHIKKIPAKQQNKEQVQKRPKLVKNSRMQIIRPAESSNTNKKTPALYQRSHSRDKPIVTKKIIGKHINTQPFLLDVSRIVLRPWHVVSAILTEKGAEGRIQYFSYGKTCIYISKSNLKGIKSLKQIIQKINSGEIE